MCGPLVVLPRLFLTGVEGNFDPRICHQGSLTLESGIGGVSAILSRRRAPWELDILSSGHSAVGRLISRLILMFVHNAFAFGQQHRHPHRHIVIFSGIFPGIGVGLVGICFRGYSTHLEDEVKNVGLEAKGGRNRAI